MVYSRLVSRLIDGGRIVQPALTVPAEETLAERPQRRKRFPLSFLIVGMLILGAVVYLVYANTQASAVYYLTVPELRTCTTCTTQSVRVAGIVQQGTIQRNYQTRTVSFTMVDNNQTLPVTYTGVVPDIFNSGIQVVVEGHYTGKGPFQAQTLLTKCPSTFQVATPTAKK
jgi:cytochrome c-type biogenesis protein CcmE